MPGLAVGARLGLDDGRAFGLDAGESDGDFVGLDAGESDGRALGLFVGEVVGLAVGDPVGAAVDFAAAVGAFVAPVGQKDGDDVGLDVGRALGLAVGDPVGDTLGYKVGYRDGLVVGNRDGLVVGNRDGLVVGATVITCEQPMQGPVAAGRHLHPVQSSGMMASPSRYSHVYLLWDCGALSDSEHPGRSCATQRFRCNQVFGGTSTGLTGFFSYSSSQLM